MDRTFPGVSTAPGTVAEKNCTRLANGSSKTLYLLIDAFYYRYVQVFRERAYRKRDENYCNFVSSECVCVCVKFETHDSINPCKSELKRARTNLIAYVAAEITRLVVK